MFGVFRERNRPTRAPVQPTQLAPEEQLCAASEAFPQLQNMLRNHNPAAHAAPAVVNDASMMQNVLARLQRMQEHQDQMAAAHHWELERQRQQFESTIGDVESTYRNNLQQQQVQMEQQVSDASSAVLGALRAMTQDQLDRMTSEDFAHLLSHSV
jgi:hypothetical protein